MSDGQEKPDDLIAELAKLMASSAGGAEEAKPAPRLVSASDAPRPATPTIRIPGMDAIAPVPASPVPPAQPAAPSPTAAAPTVLRIPGMDQPVAAAPVARPAATPPAVQVPMASSPPAAMAPAVAPEADRRPATIDFGTLPPAAAPRPEPLANWQDREIPKPVSVRPVVPEAPPVVAARPVEAPPPVVASAAPAFAPEPQILAPQAKPDAPSPGAPLLAQARAVPVAPEAPIVAGKPAPAGDSFDFDFGFAGEAPQPPEPRSPMPAVRPSAPRVVSGDPIADLIAADLDAIEDLAPPATPTPAIVRPPVQPPTARSAMPQPERPVATPRPAANAAAAPPARKPAEERFAPVFGVGGRSGPAASEPDPMDEIESLIGEAVRVELSAPDKPVAPPAAAPVVPPLTTGFAPRRAGIRDAEPHVSSPEAAILAAAAASGAEVGRIDAGGVQREASPYTRPRAKPERRTLLSGGMRQYVGMAVAGTLLLAAGFGLYWVLGMGRTNDAEAPVLSADVTPVKETPPAPAAPVDTQGSVVFNELAGTAPSPADEQLVSRDVSAETSVADVARTVGDDAGASTSESELANRKVRTVTVRPDGTIVSGDDAVAGSEALPIDRPNVPELLGADVQPSELLAALPTNTAVVDDPIAAAIATTDPATPADTALTAAIVPNPAAIIDPDIVAPIPAARPVDRAALGSVNRQQAAVQVSGPLDLVAADDANAVAAPVSASGGAYVQLSSQRTEADAQASLRTTQNRLSGLLGGRGLEIRRVDLGAKGIWYRVVLPTGTFQQATQACASFKANGADCVAIGG
ncbi:MAG: SPOR domain-containing protein [Devosia sp.]|nr:SPOR domain-containing protein [Devosia sp.]